MPHCVEQNQDGKEWSSEKVDDQADQELALGLATLWHPEDEGKHVHVRNDHTGKEANSDIPSNI